MMLRRSSSSLLGYTRCLPDPHMETEPSFPVRISPKSMHNVYRCARFKTCSSLGGEDEPVAGELSVTCTNLMRPFRRNEQPNHRTENRYCSTLMCSTKNGLLIAANVRTVVDKETVKSLNLERNAENSACMQRGESEGDAMLHLTSREGEDVKRPTHMKSDLLDSAEDQEGLSVSGKMFQNVMITETYKSVNGVALVCTEKGCCPANVYEDQHMTEERFGIGESSDGIVSNGGGGGSSVADASARDAYYQKMLEANPANPLLLSNYAKFLRQVQHDMGKAEEYYGRAILASPGDGEILSLYAKFVWETQRDAARAQVYFDRAVETAPQDCYVLASYAHFLWNSEEEEKDNDLPAEHNMTSPTDFGSGTAAPA